MWRSMMKHRRYISNIVCHRSVINSMTKPVRHSSEEYHHRRAGTVVRVICDEIMCCSVTFFVTIPDFVIDKGGSRFITVIYDEIKIFVIKSNFL